MSFKQLEHEGGEDFSNNVKNRRELLVDIKKSKAEKEAQEETEKVRQQEEYLSINNELLWDELE